MEELIKDMLFSYLIPALVPVIGATVTWGFAELAGYFRSKSKNEKLNFALNILTEAVDVVVSNLEQNFVKELKKTSKSNKIPEYKKQELRDIAVNKVLDHLPKKTKKEISKNINSITPFIQDKIDQIILNRKE